MKNINSRYFPKTVRFKEEVLELGPKAAKELYKVRDLVSHLNISFECEYRDYIKNENVFPDVL